MDPDIPNLHLFESEFQKFMQGAYTHTLEEDWERFYAQQGVKDKKLCPHGKSEAFCNKCYFNSK